MYDFVEASSLCPLSRCRTSGDRCSLCESMTNNITFTDWGVAVTAHPWCIYLLYTPIRSAKPPTGSRQVPVTNCSNLILFSLSISLTNCQQITLECETLLKQSCNLATTMIQQYDRLLIAAPVTHGDTRGSSGLLPARTRRSVCCCERSACRWCFSASLPGLSPACRTASPAGRKSMRTLLGSNNCNSFVLVARVGLVPLILWHQSTEGTAGVKLRWSPRRTPGSAPRPLWTTSTQPPTCNKTKKCFNK